MKFQKTQKIRKQSTASVAPVRMEENGENYAQKKVSEPVRPIDFDENKKIETDSQNSEDRFQVYLYNSGADLIKKLKNIGIEEDMARKSYEELKEQLLQLKDFAFDIGFAGGQSSGKSTVINSLLEYPLMPTCKLVTTCVGTHIYYGEKPRVSVVDDDTGKQVMDVDCTNLTDEHFRLLKEYACVVTRLKVVENLQYFTDLNIFDDNSSLNPDSLKMNKKDPNHVIVLLMILLTVYVDQNSAIKSNKAEEANKKRKEVLKYFKFNPKTVNYTIQLQWYGDFLKSGMTITDLPGLGAYAPDKDNGEGQKIKGHDTISKDAIIKSDAMVFIVDPQVDGAGVPALEAMLKSTSLKEVVSQSDLIIPILNKVDTCNGQMALINTAVDKFINILKNTGVEKEPDDIHRYSAWYGEYKFSDVPIERTCFYQMNYDYIREGILEDEEDISPEELNQKIREKCQKRLKKQYEKAGVEELKAFFRTAYIKKSKNRRSHATVLSMRKLALDIIRPTELIIKNMDLLQNIAGDAIKDISKNLKESIAEPIANAIEEISKISHDDSLIKAVLDSVPKDYVDAFRESLKEYKERNLDICDKFETGWLGFSDNARIDVLGSQNRLHYLNLKEEIGSLKVDVNNVNGKFRSILETVTKNTNEIYDNSLKALKKLKKDISESLDKYEESYRAKSTDKDSHTLKSVKALKDSLVKYMESQIDEIINGMETNKGNLAKTGNDIVAQILNLNTEMINYYTTSVVNDVTNARYEGGFFTQKEYIIVDGDSGIKAIFCNLCLSDDDEELIKSEVAAVGIEAITNNLNSWYRGTKNAVNKNFTELNLQLEAMIDKTVKELGDNNKNIEQRKEELTVKLRLTKEAFAVLRGGIQAMYDESVLESKDETLNRYKGNILYEIVD